MPNVCGLERTVGARRDRASSASLLVVNTTDDTDDGTCDAVHCSLREALWSAGVQPAAIPWPSTFPRPTRATIRRQGVGPIEPASSYSVAASV